MTASARLRVVRRLPFTDNFDDIELGPHPKENGVRYAPARPYWATAAKKWEIREHDGDVVLAKTLDIPLFMRTLSPIGSPKMSNYTMQVDVSTDGNRRIMSAVGVLNQRYQIVLKGNSSGIFTYMDGYTWTLKAGYAFTAEEGKAHEIHVRAFEDGDFFTPIEERANLKIEMSVHDLEQEQVIEESPGSAAN